MKTNSLITSFSRLIPAQAGAAGRAAIHPILLLATALVFGVGAVVQAWAQVEFVH